MDDAAEKAEAFESAPPDSRAAAAARRALGGLGGDAWCISAARELQRSKAALARTSESEKGAAPQPPSRSLPSLEAARASLLGGFGVEILSRAETASAEGARDGIDAFGTSAAPLVAVGSAIPLPPLPYWLLAPCSPKSSVAGWGAEGAAGALALLLALESSGSLVTRDLPADAKLASVSGTFCLGREVWTHAGVAAAAAALTDLYWDRLETELSSSAVNPRMGSSAYGFAGDARGESRVGAGPGDAKAAGDAKAVSAARLSEALCDAFANESFGDRLFARHVALRLRAGAPARARAAAWNALRDGLAFHLLPPLAALAPRPERGDSLLFLPPGGEQDPEMLELYLKALESGALDRCLLAANGDEKSNSFVAPPLPAVLALHAATHAALGGGARATATIRRVLSRGNFAEDGSGSLHPGARAAHTRSREKPIRTTTTVTTAARITAKRIPLDQSCSDCALDERCSDHEQHGRTWRAARTLAVDATSTFWQPTLNANCCSTRAIALPTPCRRHSCGDGSARAESQVTFSQSAGPGMMPRARARSLRPARAVPSPLLGARTGIVANAGQ